MDQAHFLVPLPKKIVYNTMHMLVTFACVFGTSLLEGLFLKGLRP
jgi:hypothetical protein